VTSQRATGGQTGRAAQTGPTGRSSLTGPTGQSDQAGQSGQAGQTSQAGQTGQAGATGRPGPALDAARAALAAACADLRRAGPADAIASVLPSWVAAPATIAEAAATMRAAAGLGLTVVPRGTGSRLAWGLPPRSCDLVIDTGRLDQVLEHASGDWIARLQAGVRMDRLAEVLGRAGQQLSLDVPVPADGAAGTVGGVLATGMAGPRRLRYGTPRDLVIGITVVRADGQLARSGGKVVKNVAGYDLGKLFAGSFGTLGLIVEATFRLHPVPAAAAYVTLECGSTAEAAAAVAAAVQSQLQASAVEIDRPGLGAPVRVSVLLEGNPAGVPERVTGLREALARGDGDARPASAPVPDGPPVLASAVVVHAPPRTRDLMDLWGPVPSLSLMRAVKDQFDPGHRMAPGRFAGGI